MKKDPVYLGVHLLAFSMFEKFQCFLRNPTAYGNRPFLEDFDCERLFRFFEDAKKIQSKANRLVSDVLRRMRQRGEINRKESGSEFARKSAELLKTLPSNQQDKIQEAKVLKTFLQCLGEVAEERMPREMSMGGYALRTRG